MFPLRAHEIRNSTPHALLDEAFFFATFNGTACNDDSEETGGSNRT
jgi:hypothetical protein